MVNHMTEIAKMLGVELNEEFEIAGYKNGNFKITECGIKKLEGGEWVNGSFIFDGLLTGECTINHKPWKPQYDEEYWFVGLNGLIYSDVFYKNRFYDINLYPTGNSSNYVCFTSHSYGGNYDSSNTAQKTCSQNWTGRIQTSASNLYALAITLPALQKGLKIRVYGET